MTGRDNRRLFYDPETPRELLHAILVRIELARRRAAAVRLVARGMVMILSGVLLVPSMSYAINEFYTSGFYEYVSLLFSDGSVALAHWQEISFSLAESLPSLALLILASITAIFLWSLRSAARDTRVVFTMRIT